MILTVEILGVFHRIIRLLPSVGIGSRLNFGDKGRASGGHLAIGVGVFIVQEQLDVLCQYLSARLVVDQLEGDIVRVYV